ncbi:hypothetical protein NEOLEDRAFT_1243325 [Neolentinus lepideus HHB14362 ss-1]|uniref:F-box domain-containing protein n=1 Tax=Neolentinus lepideus HHB14362 ss-1 TaxID=1314782 RepID=A0A165R5N3_9AGAM|nr:hypothetical protein NEOLEDRAFT_1243325 [Neolentinus lepideus HHB14362 ss-1]
MSTSTTVSPIHRLPVELLDAILVLAEENAREMAEEGEHPPLSWMKIGHVCCLWRQVVDSNTTIWNDIVAVNPEATRFLLKKAKRPTVRLEIAEDYNEKKKDELFAMLQERSQNVVSLDVMLPVDLWMVLWDEEATSSTIKLDSVETLVLRSPMSINRIILEGGRCPFVVPLLKTLSIVGIPLPSIRTILSPRLENLHAYGGPLVFPKNVQESLEVTPSLEYLVLDIPVWGNPVAKNVHLPNLQHLELYISSSVGAALFDWLNIPVVQSLELKIRCTTVDEVEDIFMAISPSLNRWAALGEFTRCAVYQESLKSIRITLDDSTSSTCSGRQLQLVLKEYRVGKEGGFLETVADALGPMLMPINHLEIREMAPSTPESVGLKRSLTGLTFWKMTYGSEGPRFSLLKSVTLNNLRFRSVRLDSSKEDFLSILLRFCQHLQSEKNIKTLTVRSAAD